MDDGYIDNDLDVKVPNEEVIFDDDDLGEDGDNGPITEEDAWTVISS